MLTKLNLVEHILSESNDSVVYFNRRFTHEGFKLLASKLNAYPNICFINWGEINKKNLNVDKELKKDIQRQLVINLLNHKNNHLVIDLSECELDEDFLRCLLDGVRNNPNPGGIFLGNLNQQFKNHSIVEEIEKCLRKNNEIYERFPSDYVYCLLASHCRYRDNDTWEILNGKGWSIVEEFNMEETEKGERKLDLDIEINNKKKKYTSILYKNEEQRQLVLAFRGIKIEINDLFLKDSQLESVVYGTWGGEVTSQSFYAYVHSMRAYEMSKSMNFNLSFTGYSFGACLAEQSVFFCYKESMHTSKHVTRAVTFDSPGSYNIIKEFSRTNIHTPESSLDNIIKALDIKTYIFSPNFMNTSNEHIGKVYRVFETNPLEEIMNSFDKFIVDKLIKKISILDWSKRLNDLYFNTIKPKFSKYLFYLNGLRAIFMDDLNWILKDFDEKTGNLKPGLVYKVLEWPLMEFKVERNLEKINLDKIISCDPIIGSKLPDWARSMVANAGNWIFTLGINKAIRHFLSGLAVVFDILFELINGNLNSEACLKCFEYDQFKRDPNENKVTKIVDQSTFELVFQAKYKIADITPYEDTIQLSDPIDFELNRFYNPRYGQIDDNSFIREQFKSLGNLFTMDFKGTIDSRQSNISVDHLRCRFFRLLEIDNYYCERGCFSSKKESRHILDEFKKAKNDMFVKFDKEIFQKMDEKLESSQYIYIYGGAGLGKESLVNEYGYHKKREDYTVQYLDSEDLGSNLLVLRRRFLGDDYHLTSSSQDGLVDGRQSSSQDDLIRNIRYKIKSFDKRILFLIFNVKKVDDIERLLVDFSECKFVITTKNKKLFEDKDPSVKFGIEIQPFDKNTCFEYLSNLRLNGFVLKVDEKAWEDILKKSTNCSMKISPKAFVVAVHKLEKDPDWGYKEAEEFLKKEYYERFKQIANEDELAYEILTYLAYLDGNFIDYEIIKQLFYKKPNISKSLTYLLDNRYLNKRLSRNGCIEFEMKEEDQKDIKSSLDVSKVSDEIIQFFNMLLPSKVVDLKREKLDKLEKINRHGKKLFDSWKRNKDKDSESISFFVKILKINKEILLDLDYSKKIEKEILRISKTWFSPNSQEVAQCLMGLGSIYEKQGKYSKALMKYEDAYEKLKRLEHFPKNHPDLALALNRIGLIYDKQGDYKKALKKLKESLELKKQTMDPNDLEISGSLTNISLVYSKLEDSEKAIKYSLKSLEIKKKILGHDHPDIANELENIANIYTCEKDKRFRNDNYRKAVKNYKEALKIKLKWLPPNHLDIAGSLNNISYVYIMQERYGAALETCENSLELRKQTLPFVHPLIAQSIRNIGYIYLEWGKYDQALENLLKSREILKKCDIGPNHPSLEVINTLINEAEEKKTLLRKEQEVEENYDESRILRYSRIYYSNRGTSKTTSFNPINKKNPYRDSTFKILE